MFMKFFHLSDLHIGLKLMNRDLREDQEYILDEIRSYYDNLYYRTSPEQIKQGMPTRYGFHTNVHTKPTVINFLKAAMRDNLYLERSLPTILEYNLFEIKNRGCDKHLVATFVFILDQS